MSAAALWKVVGSAKFELSMLKDSRFLRVFAIAVGCHMLWDWSFDLPFYAKYMVLGVVAWIVIFALIQDGLKQLRAEKEAAVPIVAAAPAGEPAR
jgi:RsiW-degrading membrane proteinase PrsW (M82 family)